MNTTLQITKKYPNETVWSATTTFPVRRESIGPTVQFVPRPTESKSAFLIANRKALSPLDSKPQWQDKEYRQAYMEAAIEQGVAWQIKINRKFRSMSQKQLAQEIGTQQSGISRLEDPEHGAHRLETLIDIAKAFDCALLVKFISYADLAKESEMLSETDQYAAPYILNIEQSNG
jgi:transcriptional regulator with XRE-family HTH domain